MTDEIREYLLEANRLRMSGVNMLMVRTMSEFGAFCDALADYVIHKKRKGLGDFGRFFRKKGIARRRPDLEDPTTYARLFAEYWRWLTGGENDDVYGLQGHLIGDIL